MLYEINAALLESNLAEDVIYAKDHPKMEESKPEVKVDLGAKDQIGHPPSGQE